MSKPQHTPGPWIAKPFSPLTNAHPNLWGEIQFGTDEEVIAEGVYEGADARLIAAAPDMLEALKNLSACISETRGSDAYLALIAAR